jgi:hypothetical protein
VIAMTFIELTWLEMFNACTIGVARRISSIARGLNKNKHAEVSNFQTDVEGAIAEACFAKQQNRYWGCGINTFKAPDVGDWQVRGTGHLDGHCIVRPNDRSGYRIAFLTVPGDRFGAYLIGWIDTDEAKVDRYWREDKSGWWVPQAELTPFEFPPSGEIGIGNATAVQ